MLSTQAPPGRRDRSPASWKGATPLAALRDSRLTCRTASGWHSRGMGDTERWGRVGNRDEERGRHGRRGTMRNGLRGVGVGVGGREEGDTV